MIILGIELEMNVKLNGGEEILKSILRKYNIIDENSRAGRGESTGNSQGGGASGIGDCS